jgi:hypothetical protein
MTGNTPKITFLIVLTLLVGLAAALPVAAQTAPSKTQTITGCLEKGLESGGHFLVVEGQHHWELYPGKGVALESHVGQTVALTGSVSQRTAEQEKASQPYEKKETGQMQHSDFHVTSVKMVSPTCSR